MQTQNIYECEKVGNLAQADLPAQSVRAIVNHKIGNSLAGALGGLRDNARLLSDLLAFVPRLASFSDAEREVALTIVADKLRAAIANNNQAVDDCRDGAQVIHLLQAGTIGMMH